MLQKIQETAKRLLAEQTVSVVIGYGINSTGGVVPVFITSPDDVSQLVWNAQCRHNLTTWLTRKEVKKFGKAAVVLKACELRALVVLVNESQIKKDDVYVIGVHESGVVNAKALRKGVSSAASKAENADSSLPLAEKCLACEVHDLFDKMMNGTAVSDGFDGIILGEKPVNIASEEAETKRYARLNELMKMSSDERFEFWKKEFSRCFKCYACRQNCPLCYCNVCVADKNKPQRIDTSATPSGNFAWNILRAFHLAGRCVGCGACSDACPAGIELDLLNLTLARAAKKDFQFEPGTRLGDAPLIGTYSENDKEEFIR